MDEPILTIQTSRITPDPDPKLVALKMMLDDCGMDYPIELIGYFCENYKISQKKLKEMCVTKLKGGEVVSDFKGAMCSYSKTVEKAVLRIEIDLKKISRTDDKMVIEAHIF